MSAYSDTTDSQNINSAETPESFGSGKVGEVRRWAAEINLATGHFTAWLKRSKKNFEQYRARDKRKNSYNCLYANTSTIYPHIYNTAPTPDIRKRWESADKLGKAVSEVLSRAITFNAETTDMDRQIRMDVLDMLICARGISRVRYVPSMVQVGDVKRTGIESEETDKDHETQEGESFEELEWETAPIEHVAYDAYLHGPGKTWQDVPWFAFKHNLTRDELINRFGAEKGSKVPLDSAPKNSDKSQYQDDKDYELFKTACVWEIWDKETKKVLWINLAMREGPLKTEDDPYSFDNFFPVPEPLIAIIDSDISYPVSLFEQYEDQANELNELTNRINRIVAAMKTRAIYDPSLGTQVNELFRGEDNDLIPASQEIRTLREAGGIDKFIWFPPFERMAATLTQLYASREQCKSVIYEITGIADIMRGSSDAQETFGAQALKVAFGKGRVSDMQRNVQRYIRDLIQMQAQVIAKKFELTTLQQMTNLEYPTNAQYAAQIAPIVAQYQQAAMAAMMQGQPPPPRPQLPPKPTTWEDIAAMLKSDAMRSFRIDIETDSTIAAVQQENIQNLQLGIEAMSSQIQALWPMVQQQIIPFEVAKEFLATIASKFKMGNQLEDVVEQMQPPPQGKPDPMEQKTQADMQKHQASIQADMQKHQADIQANAQLAQMKAQLDQQTATWQQEVQARENAHQNELELQRDTMKAQLMMQMEAMKQQAESDRQEQRNMLEMIISRLDNRTKMDIAQLNAGVSIAKEHIGAEGGAPESVVISGGGNANL